MGKLFTSPLLLLILATLFSQIILFFRFKKASCIKKWCILISILCVLMLTVVSLPVTAHYLYLPLERQVPKINSDSLDNLDAIVVLRGGGDSARVIQGILTFKVSHASVFVLSGYAGIDLRNHPEIDRWKLLALEFGVPSDVILTEYTSMNTHEHPIELLKIAGINKSTAIGVVTSSWHIPRAIKEFKRHFVNVVPVKVEHNSFRKIDCGLRTWIPQTEALYWSTYMIQEYIGSLWYKIRYDLNNSDS